MIRQKQLQQIKTISEKVTPLVTKIKLLEETGELIQSIATDVRNEEGISVNTVSEMADVIIVLTQILMQENGMDMFQYELNRKLERTLKRLEEGYYKVELNK